MKKVNLILVAVIGLLMSIAAKAQTKPDYYVGKWNVTVFGTPQGDAKINFLFERKDGKMTGTLQDSTGKETAKITQIEEKDKTITAYFTAQGYDVNITLDPVDDDHVSGSLMGMFDAKGIRVKENK
ncbi:hypothetical protein GS399_14145 [Pedobacter sp. HMF7647]|uniref:Uncharacterized protein n=1 Tax=Hufsiella arboris TaxID=2695275 RepID=A0A7K1YC17_9SPHI|nr:hypothetical protein [Hufsiella arboris]MXV52115.1 hypothetical protein [Hufsiella arboris]